MQITLIMLFSFRMIIKSLKPNCHAWTPIDWIHPTSHTFKALNTWSNSSHCTFNRNTSFIRSAPNWFRESNRKRSANIIAFVFSPFRFARSAHVQTSVEQNLHRSDTHRRATLLVEISSLNHVQLVVRCLQYDIVKIPINHQTTSTNNHFRQVDEHQKPLVLLIRVTIDVQWHPCRSRTDRTGSIRLWFPSGKYCSSSDESRRNEYLHTGLLSDYISTRLDRILSISTHRIENSRVQKWAVITVHARREKMIEFSFLSSDYPSFIRRDQTIGGYFSVQIYSRKCTDLQHSIEKTQYGKHSSSSSLNMSRRIFRRTNICSIMITVISIGSLLVRRPPRQLNWP